MTPEGWTIRACAEVVSARSGFPFSSEHFTTTPTTGRALVRVRDLESQSPSLFIGGDQVPVGYEVRRGDLLVGMDGEFVARRWSGADALLNQRVCKLWPTQKDALDELYLRYCIEPVLGDIEACTGRTTVKHLSLRDIAARSLLLPPLVEQRKIAAILSSVDDAIDSTQAVIDQLDVVKKAMMAELLTRGIPGRHTRFKMTEIGDVPEEWDVAPLASVATMVPGFAFPKELQAGRVGTVPFIKCSDMSLPGCGRVQSDAVQWVDDALLSRLRARVYPRGTVIFPKLGAALLTNKRRMLGLPGTFDNNVMGLVSKGLDARFLFYVMQRFDFAELVQPGAVPSLNSTVVGALEIAVPPAEEAQEIAETLEAIDLRCEAEHESRRGLEDVRSALMSVLLTGEVRVKPDEDSSS